MRRANARISTLLCIFRSVPDAGAHLAMNVRTRTSAILLSMTLTRPTDIVDMKARMERFSSEEGQRRGLGIEILPSDVFINTYPKAGTTWVQQIVHQLRSGGDMEFGEICEVVPWLELAYDSGIDPLDQGGYEPRVFKTHLSWSRIPKGGRYIYVVRDPIDTLRSFYSFFDGWLFEPGSITVAEFATEWFMQGTGSGNYWEFIVEWWPQLGREDVLAMTYEHMIEDPVAAVRRIARFIGIDHEEAFSVAVENSSRLVMAENAEKFDEHVLRAARDPLMGLPPGGTSHKARARSAPIEVADETIKALDALWAATVEIELGFADYAELAAAIEEL